MPTKVLTDPQGLNQALQSGIQAVNGFAFDAASAAAAAAAAAAANGVAYPEAYQVTHHNNLICWSTDFIYVSLFFLPQTIMDVLPAEMPASAFQDFPPPVSAAAEALPVPPPPKESEASNIPTIVTTPSTSLVDNVALPPTSKSVIEAPPPPITVQETIVTHLGT